jgi:hypothetical protein
MLTLIIEMRDVIEELQMKVEEALQVSGLEVADDVVKGLFLGILTSADTVYEHIDSDKQLNLLASEDIDRALKTRVLHDTYRGDLYCLLIELCNEDNATLRQIADYGVDALGELFKRFIRVMHTHPGCRGMINAFLSTSTFPTGLGQAALIPTFQEAYNNEDVIVTIVVNPALTGAA